MPFCGHCGAESPSDKIFCGHCGQPIVRGTPASKPILGPSKGPAEEDKQAGEFLAWGCLGFLVLVGIITWFTMSVGGKSNRTPQDTRPTRAQTPEPAALPVLTVLDYSSHYRGSIEFITGRAKNISGRRLNYAQITFDLWNARDEKVGTAYDNIRGLEPGETWKFEAMITSRDATQYKLAQVSGY